MDHIIFFWSINMCFVFLLSAVFTGVLIPKILLISFRKKLFDEQNERKIHRGVVPRLGGIAFKPVIFFSIIFTLGVNMVGGRLELVAELQTNVTEIAFGWCSIIVLYLVGVADDLIGVRYRAKFFVQISCGLMFVVSGLWIDNLHGLMGIYELSPYVGYPLTVFVVVFITNAINLIDGIDGLASGLSGIALLYFGFFFMYFGEYMYALLAFAALGTIVPFFYYNVFGTIEQGKKIFMGDTGSLTIGSILSFLCIKMISCDSSVYNPMILACVPLIVPCFDVIRVVIHRFRIKKHLFKPDTNHIHHKVLKIGVSPRRAMILILIASAIFIGSNLFLSLWVNINLLLLGDVLCWTFLNIWLTKKIKTHQPEIVPGQEEK